MTFIRSTLAVSAIALSGALSAALPASAQDASTVLATVGGVDITLGHVIAATENLPEQYASLPDQVLLDGLLGQMIEHQALAQSLGDALDTRAMLAQENQLRAFRADIVLRGAAEAAVTEEAVQAAYEAEIAGFEPAQEFNASHILVATEAEAAALLEELTAGADFATLAQEKSTGPSGPNGGELGWFGGGMMVPEFEAAVMTLAVGEVSAPVQTQFGWHVVRLNDARDTQPPSLDALRADIEGALQQSAAEEAVTSLTEGVEVVRPETAIDATLIRKTDLID